jgi:hypothetical protein
MHPLGSTMALKVVVGVETAWVGLALRVYGSGFRVKV